MTTQITNIRGLISKTLVLGAVAIALSLGVGGGGVEAAKTQSLKCTAAESGMFWANDHLAAAQKSGDKAGQDFWSDVSWGFQSTYLAMGCGSGGAAGLAT